MPATDVLDIVRANFSRRQTIQAELREIDEATTNKETGEVSPYSDEQTEVIEKRRAELGEIDARIEANLNMQTRAREIEGGIELMLGAMLDKPTGQVVDTRSVGARFADNDEYRAWAKDARGKHYVDMAGVEYRTVTDTTLASGSAGTLVRPQRLDRMGQDFLDRKVYLLDLLPVIPVTQGTIEYVQDTTPLADIADKGVEIAEQGAKPQAGATFSLITEAVATIAEWANITRQAAADVPQVTGYLDGRMRYGLKRRADKQSINGDGVSPNLKGLANRSGIVTYAPGSSEARYKSIRHAIRLGEDNEAVYEIVVLNPADAEIFDLSNETSAGLHAIDADGGVARPGPRTAWGLTQVRSTAIASGTALLIDPMHVALFDRQQVTAYMTDSHASNFTHNILTLLLETRLGLGLFDPAGVCKVTFNGSV